MFEAKKNTLILIRETLVKRQQTIAVAESVTTGLLQHAFGTVPNASDFYQGGITAYNLGQKCLHLSVEPIHAANVDCVSSQVAGQMAVAACRLFYSTWGIGVTGYVAPKKQGAKSFCYLAIAFQGSVVKSLCITGRDDDPGKNPEIFVSAAIDCLRDVLRHQTVNEH